MIKTQEKGLALAVLTQAARDWKLRRYRHEVGRFLAGGEGSTLELWCALAGIDKEWYVKNVKLLTKKKEVIK